MQLKMPEQSQWLRVRTAGAAAVDTDNRVINGYVVAQAGPFMEPDPRGEFDEKSLRQIVKLMKHNSGGTKVRFTHPSLSGDGLGKFLGRAKNPRLDSVMVERGGEIVTLAAVRADLHLSETAFENNPNGNLGQYVLDLAQSDPDAFSSSLVLDYDEELRLDNHGKPKLDDSGRPLPALWRPTTIHASDVVDTGAAVNGFLSADVLDGLPDAVVRKGCDLLDAQFSGQSRDVVRSRLSAFVDRYLSLRFGETEEPEQLGTDGNDAAAVATETSEATEIESEASEPADEALALEAWVASEDS